MKLPSSGGIFYHWKSLRYRRLWQPFHHELQTWMQDWRPRNCEGLVIIGASGGSALASNFLQKFPRIVGIDPDPLAAPLFYIRHGRALRDRNLTWDRRNYFTQDTVAGANAGDGLREIRHHYPAHAILLSNLLGQFRFLYGAHRVDDEHFILQQLQSLTAELVKGPFLSFHDRLSGQWKPSTAQCLSLHGPTPHSVLVDTFYPSTEQSVRHDPELQDHFVNQFFDEYEKRYFVWEQLPNYYHLIEGVSSINSS